MSFDQGHALVIGVGSHKYAPGLDVPITVADAQEVAAVLFNSQYCGYPKEHVEMLHDGQATREGILAALDRLAQRAGSDDTVLFFYCGHGDYGVDNAYYLVSHDAQVEGDRLVSGSGVSEAALLEKLRGVKAKRVLLIFNACHSGEIAPALGVKASLGSQSLPNTAADALLGTGSGRIIITACREEQYSYIGDGKLTSFTQALVDGLRGKDILPRGGFINAFDLYLRVYEVVTNAYGKDQEPELSVIKGVGPFAVALHKGASQTNLGLAEAEQAAEGAVRQVKPEKAQRLYQQVINTGGGAYIGGNVNTGGGAFVGRDQINQGDQISVGDISGSSGIAIGRGARASVRQTVGQGLTPAQFNALLAELRAGLAAVQLDPRTQRIVESDLEMIELEASGAKPDKQNIETRLENIQKLLQKASGVGAAAVGLAQVAQKAIEVAGQVFR